VVRGSIRASARRGKGAVAAAAGVAEPEVWGWGKANGSEGLSGGRGRLWLVCSGETRFPGWTA
jgi:hypothetical protein